MTLLPIGVGLLFSAVLVLGFVLLAPGGASVPLDRRRPIQGQADSQLTRFAGSAVHLVDGFFSGRKVRLFNRESLEQAGLRLSQADFYVLLLAGAVAGGLAGFVVAGPLLAVLLVLLAPVVGHLVLGILAGNSAIPCSCSPAASGPGTASCAPLTPPRPNRKARRRKRCAAS
jgi:tight adherence protein B